MRKHRIIRSADEDMVQLLKLAFSLSWASDTSSDLKGWTQENPSWGHSAVAAIAGQTILCGDILVYAILSISFAPPGPHFRNRLIDGTIVDFTDAQFGGALVTLSEPSVVHSVALLRLGQKGTPESEELGRRYGIFRQRVFQALS